MTSKTVPKLIPIPKWNEHHEWPTTGGLRYLVFHADTNGFNEVIVRCGRRILIDEAKFFAWVEKQGSRK